ncbi:MAG: MobC family plasmid mobilization relaxosome protein [Ruminococcus flavefaciens]|nr:MobC family plasmid mobilization relaxosome protein [Ruminococcus flavefaciens]
MNNDNRNITLKFRVNESEAEFIENKFRVSKCKSKSRFIRLMIIEGVILHFDEEKIRSLMRSFSGISSNINQIAVRVNSTGNFYKEDFAELQKGVDEILQQQRYFQSVLLKLRQ